jgi:hypothetical protein
LLATFYTLSFTDYIHDATHLLTQIYSLYSNYSSRVCVCVCVCIYMHTYIHLYYILAMYTYIYICCCRRNRTVSTSITGDRDLVCVYMCESVCVCAYVSLCVCTSMTDDRDCTESRSALLFLQ